MHVKGCFQRGSMWVNERSSGCRFLLHFQRRRTETVGEYFAASRRSRLVRLALECTSSRTNRARESPDEPTTATSGFSARRGKCPCQCRCDVCSNLSCYTCRWHQNSSRSCCTKPTNPSPHHSTLNRPGVRLSKALRAKQHDSVTVHGRPAIRAQT